MKNKKIILWTVQILNKENKLLKDELNSLKSKEDSDINGINKSLKEQINNLKSKQNNDVSEIKNEAERKEREFQQRILLKVYPVGSYYWSNDSRNPIKEDFYLQLKVDIHVVKLEEKKLIN